MNRTYYVEVAEGGPWLAQDGTVTSEWEERGLWSNEEEAAEASKRSMRTEEKS